MSSILEIEEKLYLYNIIEHDGNMEPLTSKHSYTEIAAEIGDLIVDGILSYSDGKLALTDLGKADRDHLMLAITKKRNGWISKKIDDLICPIPENDIYLPSKVDDLK